MFSNRFTQFFKWRSSVNSKDMRILFRNQFFVFFCSHRFKKSIRIYQYYRKRWQDQRLMNLFRNFRASPLLRNYKFFPVISAAGLFSIEDWQKKRIYIDDEVRKYFDEFETIDRLKKIKPSASATASMTAASCYSENEETDFDCMHDNDLDPWEFYVQKDNMITWRREEGDGNYIYKVYVKYDDITAEDFLFVQTDVNYRREWDNTAVKLDVVDEDPEDDQQIIYWEMLWPRLFANRDYVFIRKYFIDRRRNLILICCKSLDHPQCPEQPHLQRVKNYWSYMVIKPTINFNQRGFEFILTYYDNPGIKIPKYITNYVAQRQLPEFIEQLYHATVRYAEKKLQESYKNKDPGFEYPADIRLDEFLNEDEMIRDNVNEAVKSASLEKEAPPSVEEERRKSWWSYITFDYL